MHILSTFVATLLSCAFALGGLLSGEISSPSVKNDDPTVVERRIESGSSFVRSANDGIWSAVGLETVPVVSGDETLDGYIDLILDDKVGRDALSLRRAYEWIGSEDVFPYLTMPNIHPSEPWEEWSVSCAVQMASMGQGNCYRYASLMCWIARALGYDAHTVSGYLLHSKGWTAHGWVEVDLDGETLVIDPQQHARPWNEGYDFFLVSYDDAPAFYTEERQTVARRFEME